MTRTSRTRREVNPAPSVTFTTWAANCSGAPRRYAGPAMRTWLWVCSGRSTTTTRPAWPMPSGGGMSAPCPGPPAQAPNASWICAATASGSTAPTTKSSAGRGPKWSAWKRTVSSRVKRPTESPGPRDVVAVGVTGPGGAEQRAIGQQRRVIDVVGELAQASLPLGLDLLLGEARHPQQLGQHAEHRREVLGGCGQGDRDLVLAGEEAERGARRTRSPRRAHARRDGRCPGGEGAW